MCWYVELKKIVYNVALQIVMSFVLCLVRFKWFISLIYLCLKLTEMNRYPFVK